MIKKSPTVTLFIILLILTGGALIPTGLEAKETKEMAQSEVAIVSAASFNPLNIAPGSMVSAFGQKLATTTASATDMDPDTPGVQLPKVLGGARIKVQGQNAGLIFVSPFQINFVVPENLDFFNVLDPTRPGVPVEVIPGDGPIITTTMTVFPVSPAVYTVDSSGGGLPAATLLRVKADGRQVRESLYRRDENGEIIPIPIDLIPEGEKVFLILFLTGIGHATGPFILPDVPARVNIRVLANGYSLKPTFAGPQGDFAALDQINVELPRELIGNSTLKIAVTAIDEVQSNETEVPLVLPKATFGAWGAKGLSDKRVNSLGASGETIFAGAPMEIFRSTNGGDTWALTNWGFGAIRPTTLAFTTTVSGSIYAATERHGVYFAGAEGMDWLDTARVGDTLLTNQRIFSIASTPRFVFAGSDGLGVFRRGALCCGPWTPFNAGLNNLKVTALTARGNRLLAGTSGSGIFVSTNNGASWVATSQGLPANSEVSALALGDNGIFAGLTNGIYRSTDGGGNWSQLTGGLPMNPNITSLEALGPNIFAGVRGAGVYMSTDSGATWRAINQGLTNQDVLSLRANNNILYAGTTAGVFATNVIAPSIQPPVARSISVKTLEDSPLMINLQTGGGGGVSPRYEITIEPRNGSLITSGSNATYIPNENFNGVDEFTFRVIGNNIGSRPAKVTIGVEPVNDPPKVSVSGDVVIIAGQFAPLRIDARDPDNLIQPVVTANNLPTGARFISLSRQFVWVPSEAGVYTFSFTATDDGNPPLSDTQTVTVRVADNPEKAAWSELASPNNLPVLAVFTDGSDVYAATSQPGINPNRLFKSVDQGANWTPADNGLFGPVQSIQRSSAALFAITNANVYRSTDNGANWTSASGDLPRRADGALSVTALKATNDKVFVATSTGIFVTTDQGARWVNITGDLPFLPPPPNSGIVIFPPRIGSLEIVGDALFASIETDIFIRPVIGASESQPQTGLSAEQAEELASEPPRFGVFRTTNNGMNWVAVNNGLQPVLGLGPILNVRRVIASGTRLYALSEFQLFVSSDMGAKWTPISNNLPGVFSGQVIITGEIPAFRSFVIVRDQIYLAIPISGLFLSRTNGADWLPINIGLFETSLRGLEISGSKLFAATAGGKLYVRSAM
ncbi:MAG TPA: Ig-like domain-containing protein [Blastocatellia bacterium]|nr:Ig-like domain-containing protein [Blastocatellia bacterium]